MRCDSCGKDFKGQGVRDTRSEGRSLTQHWLNRTIEVTICGVCAARRRKLRMFWFQAFIVAFGTLTLIAIIFWW